MRFGIAPLLDRVAKDAKPEAERDADSADRGPAQCAKE
jgi:hypothetical protein